MDFGNRLKQLRAEKRITQLELAKAVKKNRSTIAGYESENKQPDFDTLKSLADFFNVSIDYILCKTDIRSQPKHEPRLPEDFISPQEAMKFILEQNVIMGFGGFDINKLSDEEVVEFANELLNQLRLLSYKYKK